MADLDDAAHARLLQNKLTRNWSSHTIVPYISSGVIDYVRISTGFSPMDLVVQLWVVSP